MTGSRCPVNDAPVKVGGFAEGGGRLTNIELSAPQPIILGAPVAEPIGITPGEILESIGEAFYALDRQWRFVYVNGSCERFFGRDRADILGRVSTELFPQWVGSPSQLAHQRVMETSRAESIQTISSVTGTPVEINIFPRDGGVSVYFRDIREQALMQLELHQRNEMLRLAESAAGIGVWDMDLSTGTVRATPQFFDIVGLPPSDDPVPIDTLRALRHPDDREQVVTKFKQAIESGADQYEAEYRIIRPDGTIRWIFGRGRVFRDLKGVPFRYSGVDIDITERKKFEDHLALTTKELSHRTKNLLTVVQAMVRQIGRRARNFAEFEGRLQGCLMALAHCHDLLVENDWHGADLGSLVALQAAPYGGLEDPHFQVKGPSVKLAPQAAQLIGLALHELATNAAKHGALSSPQGLVSIEWQVSDDQSVRITWQERNGPPVIAPTSTGFGHVVLERMAATLDSDVSLKFPTGGLRWSIRIDAGHIAS